MTACIGEQPLQMFAATFFPSSLIFFHVSDPTKGLGKGLGVRG